MKILGTQIPATRVLVDAGFNIGGSLIAWRQDVKAGAHPLTAAAREAGLSAVSWAFPGLMWGMMGYGVTKTLVDTHHQMKAAKNQAWTHYHRPNMGGQYMDTRPAATMRQRSAQAMQQHQIYGRSFLGQEGRIMHR